ncbi:MAG: hypothetical protein HUU35_20215, partial [Armatimonadetes bacterium]|nr:hypothetical protein [Armatimonadota bacterium]
SWLAAPLRFQQGFALSLEAADVPAAPEECDLTSTVYWYAAQPYADRPAVPPYDQRSRPYLGVRPSRLPTLRDFFDYLKADPNLELNFSDAKDTLRVGVYGAKYPPYPRWLGEPQPRPENPHPGRTGIMAVAPASADQVCRLAWKVALPADAISLVYAFSVDPYEAREQTDVVVAMRAFDGVREYRLHEAQLRGGEPRPEGWHAGSLDIQHLAGREIVFTVDLVPSGATASQANEELYLDRLAIIR